MARPDCVNLAFHCLGDREKIIKIINESDKYSQEDKLSVMQPGFIESAIAEANKHADDYITDRTRVTNSEWKHLVSLCFGDKEKIIKIVNSNRKYNLYDKLLIRKPGFLDEIINELNKSVDDEINGELAADDEVEDIDDIEDMLEDEWEDTVLMCLGNKEKIIQLITNSCEYSKKDKELVNKSGFVDGIINRIKKDVDRMIKEKRFIRVDIQDMTIDMWRDLVIFCLGNKEKIAKLINNCDEYSVTDKMLVNKPWFIEAIIDEVNAYVEKIKSTL